MLFRSNIADGGEGASGTTHTDETKAKWSIAKKGKTWEEIYGPEQAQKMREQRKITGRKPHSEETKKKISDALKGRTDIIRASYYKNINQYDLNNILVKSFNTS